MVFSLHFQPANSINCTFFSSEPEPQIMDHVTQQYKVIPNIARSIIYKVTADYLWDLYNQVTGELDAGNLDRLPEVGYVFSVI
jgi:hypothetical protein